MCTFTVPFSIPVQQLETPLHLHSEALNSSLPLWILSSNFALKMGDKVRNKKPGFEVNIQVCNIYSANKDWEEFYLELLQQELEIEARWVELEDHQQLLEVKNGVVPGELTVTLVS